MLIGLLWFVFIVSALLLGLIILIQEGKGGGLGEAFGGMAAETFGVKATGVNRVTAILAVLFVLSSIMINKCTMQDSGLFKNEAPAESPLGGEPGLSPPAPGESDSPAPGEEGN
ncbi:MAG: preprotein translocase subunit SecG [Planctomycetota bacterium]